MGLARQIFIITAKDLRAELRTKEAVNAALAFAVMVIAATFASLVPAWRATQTDPVRALRSE